MTAIEIRENPFLEIGELIMIANNRRRMGVVLLPRRSLCSIGAPAGADGAGRPDGAVDFQ